MNRGVERIVEAGRPAPPLRRWSRYLMLAAALLGVARPASGQLPGDWAWSVAYAPVLPLGSTRDFADGVSFRGGSVDGSRAFTERLTVGLSLGWHVADELEDGASTFEGGAVGGTAARTMNAVPILLTGDVFTGRAGGTRAFLGIGAGASWIENRTETGPVRIEDTNWHRALMGRAGVVVRRRGRTFVLGVRYDRAFETAGVEREYLSLSIGTRFWN